jgi:hypothetical protein
MHGLAKNRAWEGEMDAERRSKLGSAVVGARP